MHEKCFSVLKKKVYEDNLNRGGKTIRAYMVKKKIVSERKRMKGSLEKRFRYERKMI